VVAEVAAQPQQRNLAIDTYRGAVMFLMMAEVLHLSRVWPGSFVAYHQTHVEWAGASLHDMIQPSFSFLVGVALPYSIGSRMAKGASFGPLFGHAVWRSLLLILLGIFLRSTRSTMTNFTFEDTLTQIGLGYPFLFLLGFTKPKWQWTALGTILFGYWLAWVTYPVPDPWAKNANFGHAFDVWFLNLFPRPEPFIANRGGYLTLSFIPTLGTMILGLIAGQWLRANVATRKLLIAGAALTVAGLIAHFTGICPIVKRIWTPAWTLFSGGLCFLILAALRPAKGKWTFPLIVIGANSIAAYLIAHLWEGFFEHSLNTHFGPLFSDLFIRGVAILVLYWLVLYWMYRKRIFLKI
jgi:heparan-alpha-glucosaminide N-acetyltransferase